MWHIDFETYSECDLRKTTAWVYSEHPSTEVLCLAFAEDDGEVHLWTPGNPAPDMLLAAVERSEDICAHNVQFEYSIWENICVKRFGWPPLCHGQLHDTMALAFAMSLPGSLDGAAKALGIDFEKDAQGQALMRKLSKPRKKTAEGAIRWQDPELYDRLHEYCRQDVRVEREIHRKMLKLSPTERRVWELDFLINHQGVSIDVAAAEGLRAWVEERTEALNNELFDLTNGAVQTSGQVAVLQDILAAENCSLPDLRKDTVAAALDSDQLTSKARRVLEIRQELSKSSTKKIDKMLDCLSSDGTVKHIHCYHGAGTGRWAGRHIQPQNFPRPALDQANIERVLRYATERRSSAFVELVFGPVPDVVSSCLRGLICGGLMAADFANIEGRVLAWLAGERPKLDAFRAYDAGTGPDLYKVAAADIYGKTPQEVTKDERQVGKTAELACGYQGGVGAFQTMGRTLGVVVPDAQAEDIKNAWREANPNIVQFWYDLEKAAIKAVKTGDIIQCRSLRFRKAGSFLFCRLPSGRCLSYPYPSLVKKSVPWSDTPKDAIVYKSVNSVTRKWEDTDTYGGKLAENVTQAVARDFLAEAMLRLDAAGFEIVMHVHDEIVARCPEGASSGTLKTFEAIMAEVPAWGEGCPIAVEGWMGERFRK